MIVRRMMPVVAMMVLVRRGIDRLAIRLGYSLVDVFRFAPHVIRVRFCQSDGGGGGRPSPSLAAPSSAPLAAARLSAHAEALNLLRAILHRFLHPLLLFTALVVARVSRRRRAVPAATSPTLLRRGLRTGGRGGVAGNGGPQRRPVLLRVFGSLLRLLLLLSDQLLDQTVLVGGYVIRREQRRALKTRKESKLIPD